MDAPMILALLLVMVFPFSFLLPLRGALDSALQAVASQLAGGRWCLKLQWCVEHSFVVIEYVIRFRCLSGPG
jgi:hypothetical protein